MKIMNQKPVLKGLLQCPSYRLKRTVVNREGNEYVCCIEVPYIEDRDVMAKMLRDCRRYLSASTRRIRNAE